MKVSEVLSGMKDRALNEEFCQVVHDFYEELGRHDEFDIMERDYEKCIPQILETLPLEQMALFTEMLTLFKQRSDYAARFGFMRGLFGGFSEYFGVDFKQYGGLHDLVHGYKNGFPSNHTSDGDIKAIQRCNEIHDMLYPLFPGMSLEELETAEEPEYGCITTVTTVLDQRMHCAAYNGFYLGYTAAYECIKHVDESVRHENMSKILLTEFKLGFAKRYDHFW